MSEAIFRRAHSRSRPESGEESESERRRDHGRSSRWPRIVTPPEGFPPAEASLATTTSGSPE
jgi:hypothetical protein